MTKLSLIASPTFKAKVPVPISGGNPVDVEMVFRHRTKKELSEFANSREKKTDTETFMDMVVGWELSDEFTSTNVELLLENYIGAALATYRAYFDEMVKAKLGN